MSSFRKECSRVFGGLILFATVAGTNGAGLPERVDFNFHIRPLLSDRCFKCHGPDEKGRAAGLRLDTPEGAYAVLDKKTGTAAIAPGKPKASEVIRRITSKDPDEVMPPAESNLQLSTSEIALIRKWIEQGAEYQSHWAFNPVKEVAVPKVKSKTARNPIDSFVLERLGREKLKPSPEATRETLIRRVALDVTGLPPSLKEIETFANDKSPDAYEKMVDRYLASNAYGERMANEWLDLARYADTYGYQTDAERDMSPWRDWVIRAFNSNLSYDKFVEKQIAGDLLPDGSDEDVLATAFNRLHRQTNEGGSIEEEFRTEYAADRVHTVGTAFLGLTFECARCHDHKYDPIKQRDYYQLFAFFNNIDESGLYSHFTRATPTPTLLLYGAGAKEKHAALKAQIVAAEEELKRVASSANERFEQWLAKAQPNVKPEPAAAFDFEKVEGNKTISRVGTAEAGFSETPQSVEGKSGKALKFDGESSAVARGVGAFKRTDPFTFSLWLKPTEKQERAVIFHRSRSWTDSGSRGYELLLQNGTPQFALIHFWPGNAIAIRAKEALPLNEWTHITITYDGSSRATGLKLYRNGEPVAAELVRDNLYKDIVHRGEWGDADVGNVELTLAARFRDSGFKNGVIDEFEVFNVPLAPVEVRALASATGTTDKDGLLTAYLRQHDAEHQTALRKVQEAREAENNFVNDIGELMVMREMATRRPTFLLKRGAYDAPGEPVEPSTPEKIFAFPKDLPRNRLGFAKWLTDKRNPLTARVFVNRIWTMHFGRGLVATPEDFGSQGQLPTHPELLDWLAKAFVEGGWDIKALHKLILTSATYRQASVASPQLVAVDPENRLLARGPKHRLSAEQIRDSALSASGLLVNKLGGPSVKPYQPAGLWEESGTGKSYHQDHGESLYRRSLYTFWRRTAPPPSMLTFDATSREVCTAKRQPTATPLQPLVLLNDPQFVESARVLAEKLVRENGEEQDALLQGAFRTLLGREPQAREREIVARLYQQQLEFFSADPASAEKYISTGEFTREKTLPVAQVAATAVVANTLMNHDEFVMKR